MMLKKLILIVAASCIAVSAYAAEYEGKVKGFYINNSGEALVRLENGSNLPDCGHPNWHFRFNMNGPFTKEWVSMILMARASDKTIIVGYTPGSTSYCSVSFFYFWS